MHTHTKTTFTKQTFPYRWPHPLLKLDHRAGSAAALFRLLLLLAAGRADGRRGGRRTIRRLPDAHQAGDGAGGFTLLLLGDLFATTTAGLPWLLTGY